MSINVLWARGNKGSYDNGLLMHALRNDLWPLPDGLVFDEHMGLIAPTPGGAVVVIAGRHMLGKDDHEYLRASLGRLPWALIYHLGDEELRFPSELFRRPAIRIALQAPNPFTPIRGDRNIPYGWPEDCRAWLRMQPRLAASSRRLWGFAGQNNHVQRAELLALLRSRPDGEGTLVETPGFAQGLDREDYYELLAHSCIVPCPAGPFTPETFRFYEALEAGCIPLAAERAPCGGWPEGFNYWAWRYPDTPQLQIGGEFPGGVNEFLEAFKMRPDLLQRTMTRTLAWWIGEKRKYVHALVDDVRDLAGIDTQEKVSCVITVSPVPSHPSIAMLDDCIRRIRSYPELKRAEIIICCDGVRPELEKRRNDYEEFLRVMVDNCNWNQDWFGCLPLIADEWKHQAEMVRQALEMVRTPVVFFVEHDTFPMGDIPFGKLILEVVSHSDLNHLRLHIFEEVHPEHTQLYKHSVYLESGTRVTLTNQYSFRPHLARTSWMKAVMKEYFEPGDLTFVEDRLTSPAEGGILKGLYVYAPEGSMLRSGTVDGRQADPKAPIILRSERNG